MNDRATTAWICRGRWALCAALLLWSTAGATAADLSPFNELNAVAEIPITGEFASNIVQSGDSNEGHINVLQGTGVFSAIEQVGTTNYATILQEGDANLTSQYQQGAGNQAYANQQGTGNRAAQQQIGNNNYVSTTQVGSGNYVNATQTSNGNYLSQTQTGTGLSYTITQTGGMSLTINQSN